MKKILEFEEGLSLPCGLVNERGGDKVSWFTGSSAVEGMSFAEKRQLSDFSGGKEDAVLLELSKWTGRPAS